MNLTVTNLIGKYVISPINGKQYCRKNGQFLRHIKANGYDSYQTLFDYFFKSDIKYCACGNKSSFDERNMVYLRSCGARSCVGKVTSTVKQSFSADKWAAQKTAFRKTMSDKSDGEIERTTKKREQTCVNKYGYPHPWMNPAIRQQIKDTNENKYGAVNYSTTLIPNDVRSKLSDKSWMYDQHITQEKPLYVIASELGVGDLTVGNYLHEHGISTQSFQHSQWEVEIASFLDKHNIEYITNDRTIIAPKELDFVLPKFNMAIELCGVYWHTERQYRIDKRYHANKQTLCDKQSIRLLTIFEDEWVANKQMILTKLLHILQLSDEVKVYGRQTKIVSDISTSTRRKFFDDNHIQGDGQGSICIGLVSNGNVVAMGLFKKRSQTSYYLDRYATSVIVCGGFTKIIKYFEKHTNYETLVTFADNRWSEGKLYTDAGFDLDAHIEPDYTYVRNGKRIHKFNFRHKQLAKILPNYDATLSERDNCKQHGLYRIWDCGKKRYIKRNMLWGRV